MMYMKLPINIGISSCGLTRRKKMRSKFFTLCISTLIIIGCASLTSIDKEGLTSKYGYIDTTGNFIVEPVYDGCTKFVEGLAGVKINNKWGAVDRKGNIVIKPQFLESFVFNKLGLTLVKMLFKCDNSYYEKYCFMDKKGNCPIKAIFDDYVFIFDDYDVLSEIIPVKIYAKYNSSYIPVKIYAKYDSSYIPDYKEISYVNNIGDTIIEQWDVSTFSKEFTGDKSSFSKVGYISMSGNVVIKPQFENGYDFLEGLAAVKIKGIWGFIDTTGNIVIEPQFFKVNSFSKGLARFEFGRRWGLINKKGEVLDKNGEWNSYKISLPTGDIVLISQSSQTGKASLISYLDMGGELVGTNALLYDKIKTFREGLAAVKIDSKWGYIDTTGYIVIKPQFKDDPYSDLLYYFSEGFAPVKIKGKWGFINTTGKVVIKPQFEDYDYDGFVEGLAAVKVKKKWGFIDKSGNIVIEPVFEDYEAFSEGLAAVQIKDKWGFINKSGEIVINPVFDEFLFNEEKRFPRYKFSEGLAAVRFNGKWGYINKKGKFVIEPKFDNAEDFNKGLAKVRIDLLSE